jgi:hypothetical protein
MPPTFRLDEATLTLRLADETFELKAKTDALTFRDPNVTGNLRERLKFEFHAQLRSGVSAGTPGEFLDQLEDLLGRQALGLSGADRLRSQWTPFVDQLQRVPVLNQVAASMLDTEVRITDIVADLTFVRASGAATFDGTFNVGLLFQPTGPVRFFAVQVESFGATMSLQVGGSATAGFLGFNWP